MTVLALRRGGQADDVASFHLPQHLLEAHRREMVTLIDNDVTVVRHEVVHDLLAVQALDDGDIDNVRGASASTADLADALDGQIQKRSEPLAPLIQELAAMHEDERVGFARGNESRGHNRFAEGSGRAKDAFVVCEHGVRHGLLFRPKLAVKCHVDELSSESLIVDFHRDLVRLQKGCDLVQTAARQGNVPGKLLRAADNARLAERGQPHRLCPVEFRVLKRSQAMQSVQQDGRESFLLDIDKIAPSDSDGRWNGPEIGSSFLLLDGGNVHGSSAESSWVTLRRTPTMRSHRSASRTMACTSSKLTRRTLERKAH